MLFYFHKCPSTISLSLKNENTMGKILDYQKKTKKTAVTGNWKGNFRIKDRIENNGCANASHINVPI